MTFVLPVTQGYPLQGGMQQLQQQGQLGMNHSAGMPPPNQHQGMAGESGAIHSVVSLSVADPALVLPAF